MSESNQPPYFLITIDTEGDNLWSSPQAVTTKNADYLPRFQKLCEKHHLKPTYLTNYEMVESPSFLEFGKEVIRRGTAEIGMHLHAWNSPPVEALTDNDYDSLPYLIEYPTKVLVEKVTFLTKLLEEKFGVKMVSHRAGRWGFDERYAQVLHDLGYQVDCSVTPHVSWEKDLGDPNGKGGPDYSSFPEDIYFLDLSDISKRGESVLLEVPVTIIKRSRQVIDRLRPIGSMAPLGRRILHRVFPEVEWLAPNGRNLQSMLYIVEEAVKQRKLYLEFALHSSELMPGGSPIFSSEERLERLYEELEALFARASSVCRGATLKEFYNQIAPKLVSKSL